MCGPREWISNSLIAAAPRVRTGMRRTMPSLQSAMIASGTDSPVRTDAQQRDQSSYSQLMEHRRRSFIQQLRVVDGHDDGKPRRPCGHVMGRTAQKLHGSRA